MDRYQPCTFSIDGISLGECKLLEVIEKEGVKHWVFDIGNGETASIHWGPAVEESSLPTFMEFLA